MKYSIIPMKRTFPFTAFSIDINGKYMVLFKVNSYNTQWHGTYTQAYEIYEKSRRGIRSLISDLKVHTPCPCHKERIPVYVKRRKFVITSYNDLGKIERYLRRIVRNGK